MFGLFSEPLGQSSPDRGRLQACEPRIPSVPSCSVCSQWLNSRELPLPLLPRQTGQAFPPSTERSFQLSDPPPQWLDSYLPFSRTREQPAPALQVLPGGGNPRTGDCTSTYTLLLPKRMAWTGSVGF